MVDLDLVLDATDEHFVSDSAGIMLDEPEVDPGHGALYSWLTLCVDGVYCYSEKQPDGTYKTIREWNSPKAVRSMAALAPRAPLTHLHPREMVTPDNLGKYQVGDASDAGMTVEGEEETGPNGSSYKRLRAMVPVAIRTAKGQKHATTDAKFCSPGYGPVRINRSGVHPLDGPYDRVRDDVEWVNHIALVPNPRGGNECALALDGLDDAEIQAALDAAPAMGYAVSEQVNVRSGSLPSARPHVKSQEHDSMTPTAEEIKALVAKLLETIKDDEDQLRAFFESISWTSAFRTLQTKVLLELMGASAPEGAAADAVPVMDSLVKGALDAYMKPTLDTMAEMKAAMDAMKAQLDAFADKFASAEKTEEKVAAADAKITAIDSRLNVVAADAKLARDAAGTASSIASAAKDSADALRTETQQRLATDAAEATAAELADARESAKAFGMAKDSADAADLPALLAHLRSKKLAGVRDSDPDASVLAIARARRVNRTGIVTRPAPKMALDAGSGVLG
jgi:hypothetical protein